MLFIAGVGLRLPVGQLHQEGVCCRIICCHQKTKTKASQSNRRML
jgi:hypothetical protein